MRCHSCSGHPSGLLFQKTMDAVTTGNKTHRGEETYLRFARGDETRFTRPEEDRTPKQGAECRDKNWGGIEPMEKIFLLTFLFIGLPLCSGPGILASSAGAKLARATSVLRPEAPVGKNHQMCARANLWHTSLRIIWQTHACGRAFCYSASVA
jgi:hypothetical protein